MQTLSFTLSSNVNDELRCVQFLCEINVIDIRINYLQHDSRISTTFSLIYLVTIKTARYCCESLEHATTGDHVTAITADFQVCIEDGTVSQIVCQCTLAATAALTLAT